MDEKIDGNRIAKIEAAAPDLLAALKYVVTYHREHDSGEGELYGLDYITTCINAIRKAEENWRIPRLKVTDEMKKVWDLDA